MLKLICLNLQQVGIKKEHTEEAESLRSEYEQRLSNVFKKIEKTVLQFLE